jgi:hypothetical protein
MIGGVGRTYQTYRWINYYANANYNVGPMRWDWVALTLCFAASYAFAGAMLVIAGVRQARPRKP